MGAPSAGRGEACSRQVFEASNFSHPRSRHARDVQQQPFTHGVDLLVPGDAHFPAAISSWPEKYYEYYKISRLTLSHFVDQEFIEAFVRRGQIYVTSVDVKADLDTCLALLPTGKLVLNACKELYEELGIQGKASTYKHFKNKKFVVTVDLLSPAFVAGKKLYERTAACFRRRPNILFTCLVCWIQQDPKLCPSSIASYFDQKGLVVKSCNLQSRAVTFSFPVPVVRADSWDEAENSCSYHQLVEWAGAALVQVDWTSNAFLSTYKPTFPLANDNTVSQLQWKGFLPSAHVDRLVTDLIQHVKGGSVPWLMLVIHGFDDSIITWNREHNYDTNGDNMLVFVMFPDGNYWKYTLSSKFDST